MNTPSRIEKLQQWLRERLVVIDGAMGTMIQRYKLAEADYRGERFKNWHRDLKGLNDLLNLTKPAIIEEIHRQYLEAGADIIETNTFNAQSISLVDYGMESLAYELAKAGAECARRAGDAVEKAQPGRVCIVAGAIGGAIWGFIPGVLKAWRGAHEVVVTIMLNSTAFLLLNLLASQVFKDPGATFPRTPQVSPEALLPIVLADTRMHGGIILALLTAVVIWFLLFKTTLGFEIRTVGANASAARYAGIRPGAITVLTMSIAGGLAGLGGSVEILGITKSYPAEYIVNYGFDGIAVALLGRAHPVGVVAGALLFGIMRAGAGSMQRATDIPVDIISIVQGVILLFVAAQVIIQKLLPAARARRGGPAAATAA